MSNIRKIWNLHKVMKQQWLKTSELEEIQRKMLRGIIKHAYANVPLYHQKFGFAGIMLKCKRGDAKYTLADVEQAKKLVGYEPSVSIDEGLRRFVEWFRGEQITVST